MTQSRVGNVCAEATTLTPPAHQAGDLFLLWVWRIGSTVAPTVPSGQNWRYRTGPTGANSMNRMLLFKWAQSSSEGIGTFTNATILDLVVCRSDIGICMPGQIASVINGASSTFAFGALTFFDQRGDAIVYAGGCIDKTDTDIETPPTGLSSIHSTLGSTGESAISETTSGASTFSALTRTLSGTAGNLARMHVEVFEATHAVGGSAKPAHPLFQNVIG